MPHRPSVVQSTGRFRQSGGCCRHPQAAQLEADGSVARPPSGTASVKQRTLGGRKLRPPFTERDNERGRMKTLSLTLEHLYVAAKTLKCSLFVADYALAAPDATDEEKQIFKRNRDDVLRVTGLIEEAIASKNMIAFDQESLLCMLSSLDIVIKNIANVRERVQLTPAEYKKAVEVRNKFLEVIHQEFQLTMGQQRVKYPKTN